MDPHQAQQMIAGMAGTFFLLGLVVLAILIFLFWRIFTKAGLSGAFSLIILVPAIGWIIVLFMLAFMRWNVVPVAPYVAAPPAYPPPPTYPPAGYPPQGPAI